MEDKHLQLKHRIAFGTAMGGFFCITLLIFAPLMLYVKGNDDMWFSFRTLLAPIAIVSVTAFILLSALLSFVPKTIHKLLCCLTFGLALGLYLQCTFFNISYGSGVLDGSQIIWSDYTTYGAIDSAIWAGCIALPFALFMVFKRSWRHALMIAAGFIVLLQIGSLAVSIYQNQNTLNKLSHEVTTDGIYELSGLHALCGGRFLCVFYAPVQAHHHYAGAVGFLQSVHPREQRVEWFLTHARLLCVPRHVFQRQSVRGHQVHLPWRFAQQHRLGCRAHVLARSHGHHARCLDVPPCVNQSRSVLVERMVVGEVQMGEPRSLQQLQPFRFGPEHEPFEHRVFQLGGRTFQVPHYHIGRLQ